MSLLSSGPDQVPLVLRVSQLAEENFALFSPVRLHALAHLYGIEAIAPAQARVLEIGCGLGRQLWPIAQAWPEARILGICSDDGECAQAQMEASILGLSNLEFRVLGLADIDAGLGPFDYVLCRQHYSQLPPEAAQFLLQTAEALLSPQGLACLSYETYPGAKLLETVRDAMLMGIHGSASKTDGQERALAILSVFMDGKADTHAFSDGIRHAAQLLKRRVLNEGIQSILGGMGSPCYFVEFADRAMQAGLHCIGDAQPWLDIAAVHGNQVAVANSLLGLGQPAAMRQQYLDFSTGRVWRHSLLVRADRGAQVAGPLQVQKLADLNWASSFIPLDAEGLPADVSAYQGQHGETWHEEDPIAMAMLNVLSLVWPASLPSTALLQHVRQACPDIAQEATDEVLQGRILVILQKWLESAASNIHYALGEGPYDRDPSADITLLPVVKALFGNALHPALEKGVLNLWFQSSEIDRDMLPPALLARLVEQGVNGETLQLKKSEAGRNDLQVQIGEQATWMHRSLPETPENIASLVESMRVHGWIRGWEGWEVALRHVLQCSESQIPLWGEYVAALCRSCEGIAGKQRAEKQTKTPDTFPPQITSQLAKAKAVLQEGQIALAEQILENIVRVFPGHVEAWSMLVSAGVRYNRYDKALFGLAQALHLAPAQADSYCDLMALLLSLERYRESKVVSTRLKTLDAKHIGINFSLGNEARAHGRYRQADIYFRREIALNPQPAYAYLNLSSSALAQGHHAEAEQVTAEGLPYANSYLAKLSLYHSYLYALNYSVEKTAEEIFSGYQRFGSEICQMHRDAWKAHRNNKNMNRKLRIGYVSPDFRSHAVSKFLEPLIAHHDRSQFEVFAYANQLKEDDFSLRYKNHVDHWSNVFKLSDDELAARIRHDEIDILVDVAGHTAGNRLAVFARKPAPVSLTWLGYGYTTGISAIDYFLGDEDLCPPGADHVFAEHPWRLPVSNYVYRADWDLMGPVGALPAQSTGTVTFGTLTRSLRINPLVIDTWTEILERVPGSRLMVNSSSYKSGEVRDDLVAQFARRGIAADRLLVAYRSPPWDSLRKVDIGLDCFPHNSGTTLFDTLCMGIPYVTLAGRPGVGRIGSSILRGAGHPEWIAASRHEYVKKVVELATDLPALAQIRASLREELRASPLMDEAGFASKVEDAYRAMFRNWVDQQKK